MALLAAPSQRDSWSKAGPSLTAALSEPVERGFVASLARPGGNSTGFTNLENIGRERTGGVGTWTVVSSGRRLRRSLPQLRMPSAYSVCSQSRSGSRSPLSAVSKIRSAISSFTGMGGEWLPKREHARSNASPIFEVVESSNAAYCRMRMPPSRFFRADGSDKDQLLSSAFSHIGDEMRS